MTIRHFGLTHIALAVRDVKRSAAFYRKVLGMKPVYQDEDSVQVQTPGTHDVLVLERDPKRAGKRGGVAHFGFRAASSKAVSKIASKVDSADGKVLRAGEFGPGLPYVYFSIPDGYEIEVWFEAPTPFDPS